MHNSNESHKSHKSHCPIQTCRLQRSWGRQRVVAVMIAVAAMVASRVSANPADDAAALALQKQWDHITYETPEKQREAAYETLAGQAESAAAARPRAAEILVWQGIVFSTWAGARGGLGALSLAKKSRDVLTRSIAIDGTAHHGSAYTTLGTLYYRVPGWPIGFGDHDKARKLLLQGLALNSDGLDANFFYGDFLRENGEKGHAARVLEHAILAPARPGRETADAGRRRTAPGGEGAARATEVVRGSHRPHRLRRWLTRQTLSPIQTAPTAQDCRDRRWPPPRAAPSRQSTRGHGHCWDRPNQP